MDNFQQKPISPYTVASDYVLESDNGKEFVKRSDTVQRTYDLADPPARLRLIKDFLNIKNTKDILEWTEQYGFLEGEQYTGFDYGQTEEFLKFPISLFLQALASVKWIMKFAYTLKEFEKDDNTDPFWSWLKPREDLGDYYRIIFQPGEEEVPHFVGVISKIQNANVWHCNFLGDDELCIMSKEKLFDYPFSDDFIEDVRRSKRDSDFGTSPLFNRPRRVNFKWRINDKQIIYMAKEYLKNAFDHLLLDVRPMFELRATSTNDFALLPIHYIESPWTAINLALYDFIVGNSSLKKCRNPNCSVIGDDWPKQKYYHSEACQKHCERNGLKTRTNSSTKSN